MSAEEGNLPVEPWFWELLERSKPNLGELESALAAMDRTSLEKFLVYFHIASERAREPWDGPYIDESIGHLSEDGTEDLTDWIVAQGRDAWNYARTDKANWTEMLYLSNGPNSECSEQIRNWYSCHPDNTESGWGAAKSAAIVILHDRFGVSFYELQDELYDKYDPTNGT